MKKRLLIFLTAFLSMALLPFLSLKEANKTSLPGQQASESSEHLPAKQNTSAGNSVFKILDTDSEKTVSVDDKEFCIGALIYEMPPYYEPEALKAQCIAVYTHFCRLRKQQKDSPDTRLKGADFSADLSKGQFYITDETFREECGALYEEYRKKVESVVDEVFGITLTDEKGELADIAYFAVSSGKTENSEDIFGFESPYLKAVPSPYDLTAPDYITEVSFSDDEFIKRIKNHDPSVSFGETLSEIIGTPQRTSSGSVKSITIGSSEFSGETIREIFSLRSSSFDLAHKDGKYIFTVKGYGHGAGMSQYGANEMAKQGMCCTEILRHYYGPIVISESTV